MGYSGQFGIKYYPYEDRQRRDLYYLPNPSLLCFILMNILIIFNKPMFDNPKQPFLVVVAVCRQPNN